MYLQKITVIYHEKNGEKHIQNDVYIILMRYLKHRNVDAQSTNNYCYEKGNA